MQTGSKRRIWICTGSILLLTFLLLFFMWFGDLPADYQTNYFVCCFCFLVALSLIMGLFIVRKLDLLEPITFISAIYISMYFYAPIHDLLAGNYYWFGYNLFPFGVKATWIAFLGFVVFFLFYTVRFRIEREEQPRIVREARRKEKNLSPARNDRIALFALAIFVLSFGANAYWIVHDTGNSLTYVLTMGLLGKKSSGTGSSTSLGFLMNFTYVLPAASMIYAEYGKKKLVTLILVALMLTMQITNGFRFLVIQVAISFFVFYYLKRERRPRLGSFIRAALLIGATVLLMTVFRDSVREGTGIDFRILTFERLNKAVEEAVWFNLRIYRNYYALVNAVPEIYPYVWGKQMILGTFAMMIPRVLWANKTTKAGVGLEYIIGARLVDTGQAYPNLGEYYYACGGVGVVLCMAVYGIWAQWLRKRMSTAKDPLDLIEYAILLGCNLQLLIRGYLPSNFWYLVFSLLPIVAVRAAIRFFPLGLRNR